MISLPQFLLMLAFVGLPLLEIATLIAAGSIIGFWPTIGLLLLSAVAGTTIVRRQGLHMLSSMMDAVGRGGPDLGALGDSYARIAGGFLLIIPGFITDLMGIALLVTPLRRFLLRGLLWGAAAPPRDDMARGEQIQSRGDAGRPIVIEGTYRRLDDDEQPRS